MKGHALYSIADRKQAIGEHIAELQGRLPAGPFEFSPDLKFDDIKPSDKDTPAVRRFKLAIQRDARYATSGHVWLQIFGHSQGLRNVYEGGKQLIKGGLKK